MIGSFGHEGQLHKSFLICSFRLMIVILATKVKLHLVFYISITFGHFYLFWNFVGFYFRGRDQVKLFVYILICILKALIHLCSSILFIEDHLCLGFLCSFGPTWLFIGLRSGSKAFWIPTHVYQQLSFRYHWCRDAKSNSYGWPGGWIS